MIILTQSINTGINYQLMKEHTLIRNRFTLTLVSTCMCV